MKAVFDWFFANGGTNRTTRGAPSIPGVTSTISDTLSSPHVNEMTLGLTRRLGSRGLFRLDGVYRKFKDFYSGRTDLSTGTVTDPNGRRFDLQVTENTNDVERAYKAINAQVSYRAGDRLGVGANYTLSESKGNFNGENAGSGPLTSGISSYPEYFDRTWNAPVGDLAIDQRHRARMWATYDVPLPSSAGSLSVGLLEQVASGMAYGASGSIDTRPYVTNPGYPTPPATVGYFFTARDAFRSKADIRTDVALNYAHKVGIGKRSEIFGRFTVQNALNRQEIVDANNISTYVLTRNNSSTLQAFNPFTTTPVEGVNWREADNFGTPLNRFAYGTPRTYQFSVGFRF